MTLNRIVNNPDLVVEDMLRGVLAAPAPQVVRPPWQSARTAPSQRRHAGPRGHRHRRRLRP